MANRERHASRSRSPERLDEDIFDYTDDGPVPTRPPRGGRRCHNTSWRIPSPRRRTVFDNNAPPVRRYSRQLDRSIFTTDGESKQKDKSKPHATLPFPGYDWRRDKGPVPGRMRGETIRWFGQHLSNSRHGMRLFQLSVSVFLWLSCLVFRLVCLWTMSLMSSTDNVSDIIGKSTN